MYQCAHFFNTLLTKKGLHTPTGRAGCGHLWTSERAGQSSSVLAIAFFVFSLQRGGFFSTYIIIFFSFFQSLHERWGWGEKFCSIFFIFCKISIEIYAPEQSTSTISPIFGTSTNWYTNRWPSTLAKMPRW